MCTTSFVLTVKNNFWLQWQCTKSRNSRTLLTNRYFREKYIFCFFQNKLFDDFFTIILDNDNEKYDNDVEETIAAPYKTKKRTDITMPMLICNETIEYTLYLSTRENPFQSLLHSHSAWESTLKKRKRINIWRLYPIQRSEMKSKFSNKKW